MGSSGRPAARGRRRTLFPARLAGLVLLAVAAVQAAPLHVLFLGGIGNSHRSDSLNMVLGPALVPFGIDLKYTEDPAQLNTANLAGYDVIYLFNELGGKVDSAEAKAMIAFVEGGKGVVVSHVGIQTALGNPHVDSLFGGRFVRHGKDTFQAVTRLPSHPAMLGVAEFRAYDETYEHDTTNSDRIILQERLAPHKQPEPWTWVRTQGKGRVYYTAAGHTQNVWILPAFQKQMAVAMQWASGKTAVTILAPVGPRAGMGNRAGTGVPGTAGIGIGVPEGSGIFRAWGGDGRPRDARGRGL